MGTAVYKYRKFQIGVESVAGTPVPATEVVVADLEVTPDYPMYRNEHALGLAAKYVGPTALLGKGVGLKISMEAVTYQQIAWLLSLGLDQPVTTGTEDPWNHDFDPGLAAKWNPHAATIEARHSDGSANEDIEIEYCQAKSLEFSWDQRGTLKATAELFGRQITDAPATSLTNPTRAQLEVATASDLTCYVNDAWADADTPAPPASGGILNQIISGKLAIETGLFPWYGVEGSEVFSHSEEGEHHAELELKCLFDPAGFGSTERVKAAAETMRFFTLHFAGPSSHFINFCLSGLHEQGEIMSIGEQDGLDVADIKIVGHGDDTSSKLIRAEVDNERADSLVLA